MVGACEWLPGLAVCIGPVPAAALGSGEVTTTYDIVICQLSPPTTLPTVLSSRVVLDSIFFRADSTLTHGPWDNLGDSTLSSDSTHH